MFTGRGSKTRVSVIEGAAAIIECAARIIYSGWAAPPFFQRYISDRILYRPLADVSLASSIGLALVCRADTQSMAATRFRAVAARTFGLANLRSL